MNIIKAEYECLSEVKVGQKTKLKDASSLPPFAPTDVHN